MAETPVIPQEMTTVKDNPGDILSQNPQEMTTVQDNASTLNAQSIEINAIHTPESAILFTFQIVVCCFSLFGNLLLIVVLNRLPNSKLRNTTKLLMRYVSASHCLTSVLLIARLSSIPCFVPLLLGINSTFSVQCGLSYLSYEVLIMVTKPYSHKKFISMNICKGGILASCLLQVCFDVTAYLTMKEPVDHFCHFSNGVFNPVFLCFVTGFNNVIIIVTSTMQIFTLKAMKRVFPGTGNLNINVIHVALVNINVIDVAPVNSNVIDVAPVNSNVIDVAPVNSNVIHVAPVNSNVIHVAPVNSNVIHVAPVNNTSTAATLGQNFPLKNLTKMLTCSLFCSIICWFPSTTSIFIFSVFEMLEIEVDIKRQIVVGFSNLITLHGVLYVTVYLTMSTQIRQAVKQYLSSCICQITALFGTICAKCNQ